MGVVTELYADGVPPMLDKYEVKQFPPFGAAVFGMVPVTDLVALIKSWDEAGYKLIDTAVCAHLRAIIAVTRDRETGDAWRKQLGLRIDHPDWLMSGDTGISSKTIHAIMTREWGILHRGRRDFNAPGDGDDFGRCYRLLKRFPEYRARLGEVVAECPAWGPVAEHWDELAAVFESEGGLDEFGRQTKPTPQTDALLAKLRQGKDGAR